jgi:biotin carboxylase
MSAVLPVLAVLYSPSNTPALAFNEASNNLWQTAWVIDQTLDPVAEEQLRVLRRFGRVVDVSGMGESAARDALRAVGASGIMVFTEAHMRSAGALARGLDLPFHSPTAIERLSRKGAQRAAFAAAGLPSPAYCEVPAGVSTDALEQVLATVRRPAVVKPQEGRGSRHTYRVDTEAELAHALAETAAEPTGVIVEELIPDGWHRDARPYADYVSVETVQGVSGLTHVAVTGKAPLAQPFRERGSFIPSSLAPPLQYDITELAGRAIRALTDSPGVFHTEIKVAPEGPQVIEINGRIGGDVAELIEIESGQSLIQAAGLAALGQPTQIRPVATGKIAYNYYVQPPLGAHRLLTLHGVDDIKRLDGVRRVKIWLENGGAIDWRAGTATSIVSVVGVSRDYDEMWDTWHEVEELARPDFG